MSRATVLRARTANIEELSRVVTAMRSLAAAQVQEAERALPGIRRCADIVSNAITRTRSLLGASVASLDAPPRLVVVCSERGFVGGFNERLIEHAATMSETAAGHTWIVGTRGVQLARSRWFAIEWTMPMASHARGVFEAARALAGEIEQRLARGELGELAILATRHPPGESAAIERRALLPLPPSEGRDAAALPPLHHLAPVELLARLVGEYVAGELARALMESFASENAARLQAMEAARHHISDKLSDLRGAANRMRQEEITAELLDVNTGAEAVRDQKGQRR